MDNHKSNLANIMGGGGPKLTMSMGTLFYKGIKFERGKNWSHKRQAFRFHFSVYFLLPIIQFSNQKTIPKFKKYLLGHLLLLVPPPPQVTPM
jgi:hypothetical protein